MTKIVVIILLVFLEGCIPNNEIETGNNSIEVLGHELIINEKLLETHQEKYNLRLQLRNNSNDTVGVILSNFKPIFTIPNTPVKIPRLESF